MLQEELDAIKLQKEFKESMDALFNITETDEKRIENRMKRFERAKEKGYLNLEDRVHINRVIILLNEVEAIVKTMNNHFDLYRDLSTDEVYKYYFEKINLLIERTEGYEQKVKSMENEFKEMYSKETEVVKPGRRGNEGIKNEAEREEKEEFAKENKTNVSHPMILE